MTSVRTRFAPSPTGFMHVGGVRTALFAWLIARQNGGSFILRLEDTDQKREIEGSAEHIIETLGALGITYDEGPDKGGQFAPYRQSKRLDRYQAWAKKLIDEGRAYADPYTSDEIEAFREQAKTQKKAFLYRDYRPENPPPWDGTTALRFKSEPKPYIRVDAVMGELSTGSEVIDDFILIKSDGFPTYNFAHIIDDYEMQISHVTRTQEFLPSIPNYLNLYEALGFEMPILATLPFILGPDGNKKLSKRDGAKDVLDYLHDGYLPEAMMNFIASLGWNDGTEQEIFTVDELIEKFSLERVQRSGARFDEKRLEWMNGQHIRLLPLDDLYKRVTNFWPASAKDADEVKKMQILSIVQERLKTLKDLPTISDYFFADPVPNMTLITENKQLKKLSSDERRDLINQAMTVFEEADFTPEALQESLNSLLDSTGQKPGVLFSLIRIAVSWSPFSPALNETLAVLGRDTVLRRLSRASDL